MTTITAAAVPVTLIALDDLHDSPHNPRKIYDEADLEQLAVSLRVEGILQPLRVRPRTNPLFADDPNDATGFEIIYGHRRKRAGAIAGLEQLPCQVVSASDAEVRRWQIAENLQRKDVHPIEEAEGFAALMAEHGETPERIAEQVGKSKSYVYARVKLLQAVPPIRAACLKGEIGAEVALLIARLRTPKLQEKALAKIKAESYRYQLGDGGSSSFRQIRDMLVEKFTLDLKSAIFPIESAELLPAAGSCSSCPKRSGNAAEFDDVATATRAGQWSRMPAGADVCTDPDCFEEKKTAHLRSKAAELQGKGTTVIAGNAARQAIGADGVVKGAFVALADVKDALKTKVATVAIQDPRTGKIVKAVRRDDAKRAGAKVSEAPKGSQRYDYEAERLKREAEDVRREGKWKVEHQVRLAILQRVRDAIAGTQRSAFDLQLLAGEALSHMAWNDRPAIAALWNEPVDKLEKRVGSMTVDECTRLLLDLALVDHVFGHHGQLDQRPENLLRAAKHYGVDVEQVRAEIDGERAAPATGVKGAPKGRATPKAKPVAKGKAKGEEVAA